MTTPADNQNEDNTDEPTMAFVVKTPFGTFTAADDLPPELRNGLIQMLEDDEMPPVLRTMLASALGVTNTPGAAPVMPADGHATGCNCAELHRENVWGILDRAFPAEPHLWQAMEALFTLSAVNPTEIDQETRRAQLEAATLHLQRHATLNASPQSPIDQLITKFREQLDGI